MKFKNKLIDELINLIMTQVKLYKKSLDTRGKKNIILYKEIIKIFLTRLETNLTWVRLSTIYNISKSYIHNIFYISLKNYYMHF